MSVDVRINVGMPAHPKTKKLIRRLGTDAAWRLVCLMAWVAGNRPDGDLLSLSDEDIEFCVDWPGEGGVFVSALVAVGFLDGEQGAYRMRDWEAQQTDVVRNALRNVQPFPYDWNNRRYTVFTRDNFTCRYCGKRVEKPHCDHVMPRSRGGSDEVKNLVTACPSCNLRKSDRTPEEWLA